MIHFAIVNQDGELEGEHAQIFASSNEKAFEQLQVPDGYRKVLLEHADYEALSLDFDNERLVYRRKVDLIESVALEMTPEEIDTTIAKRPEWVRDTKMPDGRIKREKKDGTLLEVHEDGTEEIWEDIKAK
jgi:hypothetical protein